MLKKYIFLDLLILFTPLFLLLILVSEFNLGLLFFCIGFLIFLLVGFIIEFIKLKDGFLGTLNKK